MKSSRRRALLFWLAALAASALLPATAAGQTKLQPAYAENTVLPTGDYVVDASGLTVPDGIKLTISAGSTIFIPSDVGITVIGQLEVLGNRDAKVVFLKQSNSGSLAWKGIEVKSAGSLTLKFAVLRGGNKCVVSSGTLLVEDSEFNSCENGAIDHNTKLVTIRRSLFLGNAIANSGDVVLLQYPAPGASVTGSIFHGHATSATNVDTRGLAVVTSSDSNKVDDTIYVTNNTFARFDKSALLVNHAGLGTVVIVNNSFKYCGATGPVVAGIEVVQLISPQGKVVLTSNNFNSNNQPNLNAAADKVVKDNGYVNFAVEPTHRSENPQNLNDFYRLAAISPTIGKGTTSFLQSGDPLLDIDGDKRPLRDSYISVTTKGMDIGADEYKLPGPQINAPSIPAVGQGATVTVTLKGSNLPPDAIVTVWFGQTKLNVQNDPWSSTDSFSFKVSVPEDAATLRYNLTFASDEGSVTFNEVFNVVPGPKVTSVTPDKLGQGVSQVSVTLKGTDFSTSVSVTSASGGVTVDSVTRKDASTVNVVLSVGDNTPEGNVVLNVVNTDDGGRTTTAIQVQARPQITSVTPDEIRRGTTADLQLVGQAFQSGLVCSIDGDGVTIDGTVRESETNAKVSVTLTANATLGERQLSLKNPDGGTATKTVFIRSNPALTSVTPATLAQGAQQVTLDVKGSDLLQQATFELVPAGLTIKATYKSDSSWGLSVTIPGTASGSYTLKVTNSDGSSAELVDALTIQPSGGDDASNGDTSGPDTVTPTPDTHRPDIDTPRPDTVGGSDAVGDNDTSTPPKKGGRFSCNAAPVDGDAPMLPLLALVVSACFLALRLRRLTCASESITPSR